MSRKRACAGALFVLVSWAWLSPLQPSWAQTLSLGSGAPVLMWQYGGCIPGPYCNTGWSSSPVVADLDGDGRQDVIWRSEEHTSELQSHSDLVCRLLLEKKKARTKPYEERRRGDRPA